MFNANQSLEIRPFGEVQCHRVVRCLGQMLHDLCLHACIQGCGGDDFLEKASINSPRARECNQDPARAQEFKGQQVDVLVAAGSFVGLGSSGGELGRVEDDQVEGAGFIPEFAQELENIAFQGVMAVQGEIVKRTIFPAHGKRIRRGIHRKHRLCSPRQGIDREPAGVAEAIQHRTTFGQLAQALTVETLVEVEPGFVTGFNVDVEF